MFAIEWVGSSIIGEGQFGHVKLAKIKTLGIVVAPKEHKPHTSKKSILAETVILMT